MYIMMLLVKWGYLDTELSSDLPNEAIKICTTKKHQHKKVDVIDPYMIGYSDNEILFVTEDKRLDMIGRRSLLNYHKVGYLSDDIEI